MRETNYTTIPLPMWEINYTIVPLPMWERVRVRGMMLRACIESVEMPISRFSRSFPILLFVYSAF
jgi:hypothetical protein